MSQGHLIRTAPGRAEDVRVGTRTAAVLTAQLPTRRRHYHLASSPLPQGGWGLLFCNENPEAEGGQVPVPRPPHSWWAERPRV